MRISITGVGDYGILRDPPPHALPPNAWTAGQNVRFSDGVVMPTGREITQLGPLQIPPYWLRNIVDYWVYAGEKTASTMGVWAIDRTKTHIELSGTINPLWSAISRITGGVINGLVVVNNLTDSPVYWVGTAPSVNKLLWLPWDATDNWQTKGWRAASIRPHKRWLFALNLDEAGTAFPRRIRNSASAPPGSIPATWDDTDLTADAAFVDDAAADKYDFVDGSSMGDEFCAYTNQTTWIGQTTGNPDAPFLFRKAFDFLGVLSYDCAVGQGRRQYVLTQDDLVTHDGSSVTPLLKQSNRRWLFDNLDVANVDSSFVYYSRVTNELWVCFPEQGATHCTLALVIDLTVNGRVGIRELPAIRSIDMGEDFSDLIILNIGNADFPWALGDFPWSQTSNVREVEQRTAISPDDLSGLIVMKHYANVVDAGATTPTAMIERSHITFPGESRVNLQDGRILRCTAIYPTFSRQPPGDVNVYLGTSNSSGGTMTWHGPKPYNASTTRDGRVSFREQGRYLGVRFETTGGADWQLSGYDMDIQPLGYRA